MRTRLGVAAATAVLATTALAGAALAGPPDVPAPGSLAADKATDVRAEQAQAALGEVAAIFGNTPAGSGEARVEAHARHGREATMALLDLYKAKDALSGEDRAAAEAYLSRPTDGGNDGPDAPKYGPAASSQSCATNVCVHWATSGLHAPDLTDASGNSVPDYVDFARSTLQSIHTKYRNAGYKGPRSDLSSVNDGGTGKTDIYLADIGDDNLYGYCTSDDPSFSSFDISAYCVLDDDYDAAQYPSNTPAENLQVTAAHEYFHAVQYAYDAYEDRWFMEASATWAEDELFDDVDDNLFYLEHGQLAFPTAPLDFFQQGGLFHYGNWIFLRYLTERYPAETGVMPTFMRKLWDKVDAATKTDPDMYAIQAIKSELVARNTTFPKMYAKYADATRRQDAFTEGVVNNYPTPTLVNTYPLSEGVLSTGWVTKQPLHHMTFATYRVTPDAGLTDIGWELQVSLNLPDRLRGSAAIVTTYSQAGPIAVHQVPLSETGSGRVKVPFSTTTVKWVEVTLVNASSRFVNCFQALTPISCSGAARDDNQAAQFRATALLS